MVAFSGTMTSIASLDTTGSTEFIQWSGRTISFERGDGTGDSKHSRRITAGSAAPVPDMAGLVGVAAVLLAARRRVQQLPSV